MSRLLLIKGLILGSLLLISGAGCVTVPSGSFLTNPITHPVSTMDTFTWKSIDSGLDRAVAHFSTSTASDLILYRVSIKDHVFGIRASTSSAALSEWRDRLPKATLIINGAYFNPDYTPSGWLKAENVRVGTRTFDQERSSFLILNPTPRILEAASPSDEAGKRATDAVQSYPLLVRGSVAAVKEESGKTARRTFVGIDKAHQYLYFGVVPYASISLYELSQVLATLPIPWEAVLNLDGGPSTGIVVQATDKPELIDSYLTVPNVLVVTKRNQK